MLVGLGCIISKVPLTSCSSSKINNFLRFSAILKKREQLLFHIDSKHLKIIVYKNEEKAKKM